MAILTLKFKRKVPGVYNANKLHYPNLGKYFEALDEVAWDIGAKPLSKLSEGYANDEIDPWFSAKLANMTVSALLAYIQNNPDRIDEAGAVMDELRKVKRPLSQAAEDLIPFRFIMIG